MSQERLPSVGLDGIGLTLLPVVASLAAWLLRFDYTWGLGDQDEFVPYVLHLLNPEILSADWFVQTQTQTVGVRTGFVLLLRLLCFVLTPETAIALLFIGTWASIGIAVAYLVYELAGSYAGAAVAIFVTLVLTPKWTLGGNDVVYSMLVPEMAAWAIALWGVLAFLRNRFAVAGLLLGLSALLQLLVGVQATLVIAVAYLLQRVSADRVRSVFVMCCVAAVAAAPIALPILLQQLSGAGSTLPVGPSETAILAHIRAPYHYLASTFSLGSYLKFGVVLTTGLVSAFLIRRRAGENQKRRVLLLALPVIAVLCALGWLLAEVYEVPFVIKLQLFKTTVIAKVICIVMLGVAFPELGLSKLSHGLRRGVWVSVATACIVVLLLVGRGLREARANTLFDLERWAQANTEVTSLFAIPPSVSSFRSRAQRAILVNYAAIPFGPADLREWYDRLHHVAPVENPEKGIRLKAQLDKAYHERTLEDWRGLRAMYRLDYLIVAQDSEAEYVLPVVYQDRHWRVYRFIEEPATL